MRLIDGDQLEQRLLDEAARIMAEDLYGKDRQRMARGLQKAAEICRAAEIAPTPVIANIQLDAEEVAEIVLNRLNPCNDCQEWDCYGCDYKQTEREDGEE